MGVDDDGRTTTYDGRRRPTYPISSPNEPSAQASNKETDQLNNAISYMLQSSTFK